MVAESRQALENGVEVPLLTGTEVNARFPAFGLPADWDAVIQDGGAILLADAALKALRAPAEQAGRVVGHQVTGVNAQKDKVFLTAGGESFCADRVILTLGPWLTEVLPDLSGLLEVTRQCVGWFTPQAPQAVAPPAFPLFIIARSKDDIVYGFPDFRGARRQGGTPQPWTSGWSARLGAAGDRRGAAIGE